LVLCLVAAATAVPAPEVAPGKTRYDGYQVLSVVPNSVLQARYLQKLSEDMELDFWKEGPIGVETHIMVPPSRVEEITRKLTKRRFDVQVHIENVQIGLDEHERELARNKKAFDYNQYNTLADIYAEIDRLGSNCPEGCTCGTEVIGSSFEGRDLTVLSIVCNANNPNVWIDSTIHAREWLATATVFKFIDRIWNGDALRDSYNFYFLPMMNPDGYLWTWTSTRMWRKSRNTNSGSSCLGTDLNRNYATNWGISGTSTSPCSDLFHGSGPGSEPETAAVSAKAVELDLVAFVSVHTYGNYWLHPWGHQQGGTCVLSPDHDAQFQVANAAADAAAGAENDNNNWLRGNSCETIYPASGLTIEYAYQPVGNENSGTKYTFTPELRGGRFDPPASAIGPSNNEFYAAIVAQMAEIETIEGGK